MEGAYQQKAMEDLIEENRALLEELSQCKADKDFVWNLWRRLQSSQPDVTSVVSMVIAREQEKSEHKDKKVLEILQMKDEKIKEFKERLLSAEDEAHYSKTRYHDLLIENEELKQKLDEEQKKFSTKQRELSEENSYFSTLLKAHQAQKEVDDQTVKENLDSIEEEKNQLKIRIAVLEKQVSDFSEEKLNMASVIEVNATLEEKIKTLDCEVSALTLKNTEVAKNCEEAEIELTNKENILQQQLQSLQEQGETIRKLESDLEAAKREFELVGEECKQSMVQMSEKERIIQQLEENEQRSRQALMDREQEYRRGLASLQKSVADLQIRCSEYQEKETKLLQDIEKLKENSSKQREDLNIKELIIEELKDAVRAGIRSGDVSRRDDERESKGRTMERKARTEAKIGDGRSGRRGEGIELESLQERDGKELTNRCYETIDDSPSKIAGNEESLERKFDKIAVLRDLETRLGESRDTIDELKKLLELKEAELVETRRAHAQRQQRYRMLKENYQLVLEQIKTYEASNADETGSVKPLPERPEERELRHLDSDQVWKELAYYRHEYEELAKERHDVLEEIDILRVQHSHNVANIQELQVHLREEREESNVLRHKISAETQAFEAHRLEVEKLEDQLQSWQEKALRGQTMCSELEEGNQILRHEMKAIQGQNKSLAEEFSGLAEEFENLKKRYDELVNKEANRNEREMSGAVPDGTARPDNISETAQEDAEFAKQHVESLSSYDEQVKRIANRILSSPSKDAGESERKVSSTHGTQTDPVPRFVDTSVHVNLDAEDAPSMDEEDTYNVKPSAEKRRAVTTETRARRQGTPQPKKVVRKTPRRNEWASMRQRILSLTQEVNALRQSKDKAVKALSVQTSDYESLQTEYNALLNKLHVTRNSVQHLNDSLKLCTREKERLAEELKERSEIDSKPSSLSIAEWKRLEEELRQATMECIRLANIVRTLNSENEQLRAKIKYIQENNIRLEHAVTQKKTLVDEMKSKMKEVEGKAKKDAETAKNMEEKLSQLKEREKVSRVRIETLEHRLDGETREKQHHHQQLLSCQSELKKKMHQLNRYAFGNRKCIAPSILTRGNFESVNFLECNTLPQ